MSTNRENMTTPPLIEVCKISELQEVLQVEPSQLLFPNTFKEKYTFWNEVPYHSESALLHRLQEIEDEVKEKQLLTHIDTNIQKANEYICLHEKKNQQCK